MTRFTPDLFAGDHAQLTAIRRDIHRHPETAFEEQRTSQIVADKLTSWGIEVHRGLAKTGVVGTSEGQAPGPEDDRAARRHGCAAPAGKERLRLRLADRQQDACLRP